MHRSVLCNDDYIKFSSRHTIEVIAISGVRDAMEKDDERAARYEGSRLGQAHEFFCQWPGLTVDDIEALRASKAGRYNDTGSIPFTCLVNPHDESEITRFRGGTPMDDIVEAVEEAQKILEESHGEGFSRKVWNKLLDAEEEAWEKVAKGDYTKALKELAKATRKLEDWPDDVQARAASTRDALIGHAGRALDDIETLAANEPNVAKKALRKLRSKLKGTGLEERATELTKSL